MRVRPLRSLLVYFAVIFVGGALLAPWLYELAQWAGRHYPVFRGLADNPFHRFVSRSLLILALAGLWPFIRSLGMKRWADVGLVRPKGQWGKWGRGFAVGFCSLALVAALAVWAGARRWDWQHSAGQIAKHALNAALAAVVVAFLEELLFRGTIFGALRRAHPWPVALLISSVVYALVHFFNRPATPAAVQWDTGLRVMPTMLAGFTDVKTLVPGFFNLTVAGLLLGWAYQRTGNLYFSMGLHGGWIFWLKTYGFLTQEKKGADLWLWGGRKLIDGWLALAILLATSAAVFWLTRAKGSSGGKRTS